MGLIRTREKKEVSVKQQKDITQKKNSRDISISQ